MNSETCLAPSFIVMEKYRHLLQLPVTISAREFGTKDNSFENLKRFFRFLMLVSMVGRIMAH